MADGDSPADPVRFTGRGVDDDAFFNRGAVADFDSPAVSPQNGAVSDIAMAADNDIADNPGDVAYILIVSKLN
jgi:hypothetical protein